MIYLNLPVSSCGLALMRRNAFCFLLLPTIAKPVELRSGRMSIRTYCCNRQTPMCCSASVCRLVTEGNAGTSAALACFKLGQLIDNL